MTSNKELLDTIADRLFTNHAAIMIGAGFSRNAVPNNSTSKKFPDWNELGNIFYTELYGREATSPKKEYLNVLKLAEEVEATFGRSKLDDILISNIPDKEYEPSSIHKKLLKLPWVDIFTTNYDTLLERAAKHIFNRKYTTVNSKDDLIKATRPRIIKLHGSFPSSLPFTITEEDYRIYPQKNAPFVNTVQQSLLENTLCLIGFSGDDPNFLNWIGWLRDNLGQSVSKIYLIGAFNLSCSQTKLLHKRDITLVNLANNHYEALNLFINYLSGKARTNNILRWPYNRVNSFYPNPNNIQESISETTSIWKEERQTYPGWVILPEEKRHGFWIMTENWLEVLKNESNFTSKDILFKFIFELCWRLEKSLHPINKQIANIIKSLLNDKFDCEDKIVLALHLLKFYRQQGKTLEWQKLYKKLNSLALSHNLREELNYENALFALFYLDYPKLKIITEKWTFPDNTPFENAKKAGILAEVGQLKKALNIVEQSIVKIRELQQTSKTTSSDCELLSQESYILYLYQSLIFADIKNDNSKNKREEFLDRMSSLKQSLCDPIHEYEYFKILLSPHYTPQEEIEIHNNYDIGEATKTRHWHNSYKEQENALSFLLFCENTGIPFCIHYRSGMYNFSEDEARSAMSRISEYNLIWAISICCRIAETKAADELFSRKSINSLSSDLANNLCEGFIFTLNENEKNISIEEENEKNFAQVLAKILPEIISRLIFKCNTNTKASILKLINTILSSSFRHKYFNVEKIIKRFINSLLPNEIELFFTEILKLPIPKNITGLDGRLIAPLEYLKINKEVFSKNFKVEKTLIIPYYKALSSNQITIRKWGFITLTRLYELGFLDISEQQKFADILWAKLDNDGFPFIPDYTKTCFAELPHPSNKDPLKFLKREVLIFYSDKIESSNVISNQRNAQILNFFTTINYLLQHDSLNTKERNYLIHKILLFWNNNKDILNNSAIRDEFERYFYQMQWCLGKLLKSLNGSYDIEQIHSLLQDLETHNLSCLYLQCAINKIETNDVLINELEKNITSKNMNRRKDVLWCVDELLFSEENTIVTETCFKTMLFSILYEENVKIGLNIDFLVYFIDKRKVLAEQFKTQIANILDHLVTITNYANENSPLSFDEKIIVRQSAMKLAYTMWKNLNSPEKEKGLTIWKEIADNEEEFSDIRNRWG